MKYFALSALVLTFLIATPVSAQAFAIGDQVQTTAKLNVRATPTTNGKPMGSQPLGARGTITAGPQNAKGYIWWTVKFVTGVSGWVVQTYLTDLSIITPTLTPTPNPTPTPVPTTTTTVTATPSTVASVLAAATPGETILLSSGTYAQIAIINRNFATPITITSADTSNEAVISQLSAASSSGVNFINIEFNTTGSPDGYYASRMYSVQNFTFSNIYVHGNFASTDPSSQLTGMYIADSSNITFTNSKFVNLASAISANDVSYLTIANNYFTYLDKGGFVFGGVSNSTIAHNYFDNFSILSGTHPDVIQFFTANATTTTHDITVTGNLFNRGIGMAAQGIFMGDESGYGYSNVTITNNAMLGTMWQGLTLEDAQGNVNISNNIVASWPGYDDVANGTTSFIGWIFLRGDYSKATLTLQNNKAQEYVNNQGTVMTVPTDNTILGTLTDNGAALLSAWLAANPQIGPNWMTVTALTPNASLGLGVTPTSVTTNQTIPTTTTVTPTTTTTTSSSISTAGSGTPSLTLTSSVAPSTNGGVYVEYGSQITLTWKGTGLASCTGQTEDAASAFNGPRPTSGSFADTITSGRHYVITCAPQGTGYQPGVQASLWVSTAAPTATVIQSGAASDLLSQIAGMITILSRMVAH